MRVSPAVCAASQDVGSEVTVVLFSAISTAMPVQVTGSFVQDDDRDVAVLGVLNVGVGDVGAEHGRRGAAAAGVLHDASTCRGAVNVVVVNRCRDLADDVDDFAVWCSAGQYGACFVDVVGFLFGDGPPFDRCGDDVGERRVVGLVDGQQDLAVLDVEVSVWRAEPPF